MNKYIVRVEVGYCWIVFDFTNSEAACGFMDTILDHFSRESSNEIKVTMSRVSVKEEE